MNDSSHTFQLFMMTMFKIYQRITYVFLCGTNDLP